MYEIKSREGRWSVSLCNCSQDTAHVHYGNVVLHVLRDDLREANYETIAVESPTIALQLLQNEYFDVLVTDLRMPKMHGIEFLKRVKKEYPQMTVIIMTAYASVETAVDHVNGRRKRGTAPLTVDIRLIGDRPSGETPVNSVVVRAARAATRACGDTPELVASSTDANIPISLGVPAIALGAGGESGSVSCSAIVAASGSDCGAGACSCDAALTRASSSGWS